MFSSICVAFPFWGPQICKRWWEERFCHLLTDLDGQQYWGALQVPQELPRSPMVWAWWKLLLIHPGKKGQRKPLAFVTNILCNFQIIDVTIWKTNNSTNTPCSSIQQEIWQSWQIHLSWPVPLLIMIICKFAPCLGQRASDPCRKGTRLCHLPVAFQAMPPK